MPAPPKLGAANTPVSKAPVMPPIPCTPNTSKLSSARSSFFRPDTPHKHTMPAMQPIANAPKIPTKPAAGVIATRPATAPEAPPSIDGLPLCNHSAKVQLNTAAAVAKNVFTKASAATPLASKAEPALKPNHPNHKMEAPTMVCVKLCGLIASR